MNNYENQKEAIDLILQSNSSSLAVDVDTKEIAHCLELKCENCLFSYCYNECHRCDVNRIKWLLAECVEPEVDWSKVPIDTPVLVSNNKDFWYNRYFAGVDNEGKIFVFPDGRTSWSNASLGRMGVSYKYIKLAEVE